MTWLLALALIALPLAPRTTIAPGVTCPSAPALEAALVGLLPADEISVDLRTGHDAAGSLLLVRINDRHRRLLGERRLRPAVVPPAACPERTQEVAVVVAAAVGRLRGPNALTAPEVSLPPPPAPGEPPPKPTTRMVTTAATEPPPPRDIPPSPEPAAPAPHATAPVTVRPPPPPPMAPVETLVRAPVVTPARRPPAVGVWLAGSMTGGTLAASAGAELTLRTWPRLPIALGALYVADHTLALDTGQAVWWRAGVTASAAYHLPLGARWFMEGGAGGAATALHLEGRNVPSPAQTLTFDPGAALLLRLGHRGARTELWLGAVLSRWLRPQGAFVRGSGDVVDLPRWEIGVGLGGRFDLGVTSSRVPT